MSFIQSEQDSLHYYLATRGPQVWALLCLSVPCPDKKQGWRAAGKKNICHATCANQLKPFRCCNLKRERPKAEQQLQREENSQQALCIVLSNEVYVG